MYRKRNTLVKKYILPSLRIAATIIKIKAETMTKTLAVIKYTDNLIVTVNPKDAIIKGWAKQTNLELV